MYFVSSNEDIGNTVALSDLASLQLYSGARFDDGAKLAHQLRQVTNHHLPNQVQFHAEVMMDEDIPHTCHRLPRDNEVLVLELVTELSGSFTDDLDIPNDCILSFDSDRNACSPSTV